jgi:hypothetical protein
MQNNFSTTFKPSIKPSVQLSTQLSNERSTNPQTVVSIFYCSSFSTNIKSLNLNVLYGGLKQFIWITTDFKHFFLVVVQQINFMFKSTRATNFSLNPNCNFFQNIVHLVLRI